LCICAIPFFADGSNTIDMVNGAVVHDEYAARSRVWVHFPDKVFDKFNEGFASEGAGFDATEDDTTEGECWQN
jgi:hypothetical protein